MFHFGIEPILFRFLLLLILHPRFHIGTVTPDDSSAFGFSLPRLNCRGGYVCRRGNVFFWRTYGVGGEWCRRGIRNWIVARDSPGAEKSRILVSIGALPTI